MCVVRCQKYLVVANAGDCFIDTECQHKMIEIVLKVGRIYIYKKSGVNVRLDL